MGHACLQFKVLWPFLCMVVCVRVCVCVCVCVCKCKRGVDCAFMKVWCSLFLTFPLLMFGLLSECLLD